MPEMKRHANLNWQPHLLYSSGARYLRRYPRCSFHVFQFGFSQRKEKNLNHLMEILRLSAKPAPRWRSGGSFTSISA